MTVQKRDLKLLQKDIILFSLLDNQGKKWDNIKLFTSINDQILLENESLKSVQQKNDNRKTVVSNILRRTYDFMTEDWMDENLDLRTFNQICTDVIVYCNTNLDNLKNMKIVKKKKTTRKAMKILKKMFRKLSPQ